MSPGQALAESFEGCVLSAYQDIAGVWTIGRGHTGKDVYEGLVWTREQADEAFDHDWSAAAVLLNVYSPSIHQPGGEDALTDFVFNLGIANYRGSTLRTYANANSWPLVKTELLRWDHSNGQVVPGLLHRRQAEAALIA